MPNIAFFFSVFLGRSNKAHTTALSLHSEKQLNQSSGTAGPLRGLTLQIASALVVATNVAAINTAHAHFA